MDRPERVGTLFRDGDDPVEYSDGSRGCGVAPSGTDVKRTTVKQRTNLPSGISNLVLIAAAGQSDYRRAQVLHRGLTVRGLRLIRLFVLLDEEIRH
jgi:hypothetical protein